MARKEEVGTELIFSLSLARHFVQQQQQQQQQQRLWRENQTIHICHRARAPAIVFSPIQNSVNIRSIHHIFVVHLFCGVISRLIQSLCFEGPVLRHIDIENQKDDVERALPTAGCAAIFIFPTKKPSHQAVLVSTSSFLRSNNRIRMNPE